MIPSPKRTLVRPGTCIVFIIPCQEEIHITFCPAISRDFKSAGSYFYTWFVTAGPGPSPWDLIGIFRFRATASKKERMYFQIESMILSVVRGFTR